MGLSKDSPNKLQTNCITTYYKKRPHPRSFFFAFVIFFAMHMMCKSLIFTTFSTYIKVKIR